MKSVHDIKNKDKAGIRASAFLTSCPEDILLCQACQACVTGCLMSTPHGLPGHLMSHVEVTIIVCFDKSSLFLQMWTSTCPACLQCPHLHPTTTITLTTTVAPLRGRGRPAQWDQRTTQHAKTSNKPGVSQHSYVLGNLLVSKVSLAHNIHYSN